MPMIEVALLLFVIVIVGRLAKDANDIIDSITETDDEESKKKKHFVDLQDYEEDPFSSPTEMSDYEPQHSFQQPVDMLSQNWIVLNDAVATSNFLRLTPNESGRKGVVWNKFALHLDSWQIYLDLHIHNNERRQLFGGDGFAVWLLNENDIQRPNTLRNKNTDQDNNNKHIHPLLGDLYGIRRDFNGTGIIFDTYDNNNNGDNPLVFVVNNNGSTAFEMDADKDFESHRFSSTIEQNQKGLLAPLDPFSIFPSECTLDYHNKESVKVLIRYQKKYLYIYTDLEHETKLDQEILNTRRFIKHGMPFMPLPPFIGSMKEFGGQELFSALNFFGLKDSEKHQTPHFCLARKIKVLHSKKNPDSDKFHIVLSGMTGDISDNHDIRSVETKYLGKDSKQIENKHLKRVGKRQRNQSTYVKIFWVVICLLSVGLLVETISEIVIFRRIYYGQQSVVRCITQINEGLVLSYALSFVQYLLLILFFHWKTLLISGPLVLIRLQKYMTNNVSLNKSTFERRNYWLGFSYRKWLRYQLVMVSMAGFYHGWRFFHI